MPAPTGNSISLKRLRVDDRLTIPNPKTKATDNIEQRTDYYLVDAGDKNVLAVWKAPKPQAEKHSFEAATEAAMATVEIDPDAAPPGKKAAESGCF